MIGTYNPLTNPEEVKIDAEKAKTWINNGAQPTATVKALLTKAGVSAKAEKKAKAENQQKLQRHQRLKNQQKKPAAKKDNYKSCSKQNHNNKGQINKVRRSSRIINSVVKNERIS